MKLERPLNHQILHPSEIMKKTNRLIPALLLLAATIAFAAEQRYSVPVGNSQATGPANARVTLIEFIDYQ